MKNKDKKDEYEDIINLPHHVSRVHPQMSIKNRAAQFSPFAALSGYDSEINETARLTEERIILSEDEKSIINERLQIIKEKICENPFVTIKYYVQDERKSGGSYKSISGSVKRIDEYEFTVKFTDGNIIKIKDIYSIECTQAYF